MDNLRDGRLIYLFTAVSSVGRRDGGSRAPGTPAAPAKYSLPCQGLSKLQELVKYHIYSHGQVRGSARQGSSLHLQLASGRLPVGPALPGPLLPSPAIWTLMVGTKVVAVSHLGRAVWGPKVWLAPGLRPPPPPPS